jgi:hypothetical protein
MSTAQERANEGAFDDVDALDLVVDDQLHPIMSTFDPSSTSRVHQPGKEVDLPS